MMQTETIHRYPRITTWLIELLCTLAVSLAAVNCTLLLLRFAWQTFGLDRSLFRSLPFLNRLVEAVNRWSGGGSLRSAGQLWPLLLPALGWLALALLLAVLLRNALPTVRTSTRGLLVEFMGSWLPLRWESLRAIKVTEDLAAERFVLLAQVQGPHLTGWHRFYSLLYSFGLRRAFLVTSSISDFDKLVQALLSESDRAARAGDVAQAVRLEEGAWSPLFRFLLSPGSFFSRRALGEKGAEAEQAVTPQATLQSEAVRGAYPGRITALFVWGTALLALLALWRYVVLWGEFIALAFPRSRLFWPFSQLVLTTLDAQFFWMKLVSAHLLLALALGALVALRNLLPALEARPEGLRVRYFGRWREVPWEKVSAIKATEFSEQSQAVLIEVRGSALPASSRAGSALYDGGSRPGVLLTSAISNFEPLLQRVLLHVSQSHRRYADEEPSDENPLFQRDAHSWLLWLAFRPSAALDQLVERVRADETTKLFRLGPTLRALWHMLAVVLPVVLLPLFGRLFSQALPPDAGVLASMVLLLVLGLLEWPLIALLAPWLDDSTGGGEDGQRPLYLYPTTQLPRVLTGLAGLAMLALGVPVLPVIAFIAGIAWSFLLAAGLWEALYGWRGTQLLLGGLAPVAYQLIVLLVYLITQR
jgi:hypothetical protein